MATTHLATKDFLEYGNERIPYDLSFSPCKRLTIHVEPDRRVSVLAPSDSTLEAVRARLQRRAGWIAKQRRYFEDFIPQPPAKRFVAGETHRYLGRQYRLKFERGIERVVRLRGRYFHVISPSKPSAADAQSMIEAWYRERGATLLRKKVGDALRSSYLRNVDVATVQLRKMSRRWGSCTDSGGIIFNWRLVMAPPECIEYVVVHELCHLKVHDHSPKFYSLLGKCMPDWERRRKRLNSIDWRRA